MVTSIGTLLSLSQPLMHQLLVSITTPSVIILTYNPSAGSDYSSTLEEVLFGNGDTMASVRIPIIDDKLVENDEIFIAVLSSSGEYIVIKNSSATVKILDLDGKFSFPWLAL